MNAVNQFLLFDVITIIVLQHHDQSTSCKAATTCTVTSKQETIQSFFICMVVQKGSTPVQENV